MILNRSGIIFKSKDYGSLIKPQDAFRRRVTLKHAAIDLVLNNMFYFIKTINGQIKSKTSEGEFFYHSSSLVFILVLIKQ